MSWWPKRCAIYLWRRRRTFTPAGQAEQGNGLQIEPVTLEDVLGLSALPPVHRDPFDRLLVAQARRGGFHLVSHDPQVASYGTPILW